MIFKFGCPRCGQKLEATTEMSGQGVTCPSCAHQFTIPSPGSEGGSVPTPVVRLRPPAPRRTGQPPSPRRQDGPLLPDDDLPMAQLRPLPPRAGTPPPIPAQPPPVPQLTPPGSLPKVVVPAHLKDRLTSPSSPANPAVVVPGSEELDAELAHLQKVCDPTPWEKQVSPDHDHAAEDLLDDLPEAIVVNEDASPVPSAGPPPLPTSPHRRQWIAPGIGIVVLLLFGLAVFVSLRAIFRHRNDAIIEAVNELPAAEDIQPLAAAPVVVQPELPADSELDAFRSLGTGDPNPVVLSPEHAAAVASYLKGFPDGLHRDDVLAYAVKQSYRAFLPDSGVAGDARTSYHQLGQLAIADLLDRNKVGLQARQLLIAICQEQPDETDLKLAENICRLYPNESVQNAWLCLSILDAQPEQGDLPFFREAFYDAVVATPVEQWNHKWLDRFVPEALAAANAGQRNSEELLSVARSFQFLGRTKEALQIVTVLANVGRPEVIRLRAARWRMCWDEAYAEAVRQLALQEADRAYRRDLPKVLKEIDRAALARAQGLPWPLPSPPTESVEEIRKKAEKAAVDEALKQFPNSRFAEIREEAEERFRPYEIGQEVTVVLERAFRKTITGIYRSRTQSHVRIGDQNVMVEDIPQDVRIRFDPVWCKDGKEAYIQRESRSVTTRRSVCEKRLTEQFSAEALTAGGYVKKGEDWVNPHTVFEQAVTDTAEAISRELRLQTTGDTLAKRGFRAAGGTWVPMPPSDQDE